MYTRLPSGDAAMARAWPLSDTLMDVLSTPVVMLYARKLLRGVVFDPAGDPAGLAAVNLPATYTVSPTTTCAQATPFIWTVGSAVAPTVAGEAGLVGSGGIVSAAAGPAT